MAQVFIFGASTAYGTGGADGGWADMIKRKLHSRMYGEEKSDEKHYVYNFAMSGATVEFVAKNFGNQIDEYNRSGKRIAIVSVGGNNARAVDRPDNYITTPEEYYSLMTNLLRDIQQKTDHVICVGFIPIDESKTAPWLSSLGHISYFWNNRMKEFSGIFDRVCKELTIPFVSIDVSDEEWKEKYLYVDGMHPNTEGHKYIFEKVWMKLEELL